LAVGAYLEDSNASGVNGNQANNSAADSGAVYVFTRSGTTWTQQAYIKASNPGTDDRFGFSVALSGDTLAIGAARESSNAIGINGNQANNSALRSGAVYVFTRSGTDWTQQAYIKASNTNAEDQFGFSVALSGDTLAVAAHLEDSFATGVNGNQTDNSAADSGAVYVFTRSGTDWTQQTYIKASNTNAGDLFGQSVALSGDTLAIGAYQEDSLGDETDNSGTNSGAVYVFFRSGTDWTQQAYIKASNKASSHRFGNSVALDGNTLAIGAHVEDNFATDSGAVYVFTRSGTTWTEQAYLKASNAGTDDQFGQSVALSGDTLLVGAWFEDSFATGINDNQTDNSASQSGSVYIFTRSGTTWAQQAQFKASNTDANDQFGFSLALSGDILAVGANLEDSFATGVNGNQADNSALNSGAVYIRKISSLCAADQRVQNNICVACSIGTVNAAGDNEYGPDTTCDIDPCYLVFGLYCSDFEQGYVKASNASAGDQFGESVALSGDTLVIGAHFEDSFATGVNGNQANNSAADSGAVYVFTRSGTTWTQQAYIKASNASAGDQFGESVALSGDTLVVGAHLEDSFATGINGNQADNSAADSGAVYVFTRSGTIWTQQAYIKASNAGAGDHFGFSVALSGDTLAVGARYEDSFATGVNGNQANNSALNSGAVYVFTRSGTTWTQQAYIKASNTGTDDWFGFSVALSGDTLAVAAYLEDSNATGINGNQNDNSAIESGAVYVFTRSGTDWTQQTYIKASNSGFNDTFGFSLALSGDTLAVGADGEDSNASGVNGNQADNSTSRSGAVYVFTRSGTTWTQQAYIKASNTGADDQFGFSVALSGDTLLVGARYEDSFATGINGDQANNSEASSGAVYMFIRSGTIWTQQAYIKASNTGADDWFGYSLALSGDTLAVGAASEASNATGINADQADNSAFGSGAVYVRKLAP
jgi:hypothetical protein